LVVEGLGADLAEGFDLVAIGRRYHSASGRREDASKGMSR